MTARWQRVIRGILAASVSVFVAEFAHVAAGGRAPAVAGVALTLAFSVLVCVALSGRRLARVRIAASVILSQAAFHLLFDLFGTGHSSVVSPGMQMGGPVAISPLVGGSASAIPDDGMWVAHGIAAATTIVALLWGERAARSVVSCAVVFFTRALRLGALPVLGPRPVRADSSAVALGSVLPFLTLGLRHRGPPSLRASI